MANTRSIQSFVPSLWSAELLQAFESQSIAHLVVKDIPQVGGKYILNTMTTPDVADYDGTVTYGEIGMAAKEIVLDQRKIVSVKVDDIEQAQMVREVRQDITHEMGYKMAVAIDEFVVAELLGAANVKEGAVIEDAYDEVVKAQSRMNKANVPHVGRIALVSQEVLDALMLDPRFIAYFRNATILENGLVDGVVINGLRFAVTNRVPDNTMIVVHQPSAYGFAKLLHEAEAVRLIDTVADGLRQLAVFGGGVIREESIQVVKFGESGENESGESGEDEDENVTPEE